MVPFNPGSHPGLSFKLFVGNFFHTVLVTASRDLLPQTSPCFSTDRKEDKAKPNLPGGHGHISSRCQYSVASAPPQMRHRDGVVDIHGVGVQLVRGARPSHGAGEDRPGQMGLGVL